MRKVILSILAFIVLFFFILLRVQGQEISLPTPVVDSIILELADYDRLRLEYDTLESRVRIYEAELTNRTEALREATITVDEYAVLVEKLQTKIEIKEDKLVTAKKKINKLRFSHVVRTIVEIAIVVLLIAI